MKALRSVALAGGVALLGAFAAPASAEVQGNVTGGGFYRFVEEEGSKPTKVALSLTGTDDSEEDSGRAVYTSHARGNKPEKLHLVLDCVTVDGATAYASGIDRNEDRYFIAVEDGGEPGKGNDAFGIAESSLENELLLLLGNDCGAGSVATESIKGGNYQVSAAE